MENKMNTAEGNKVLETQLYSNTLCNDCNDMCLKEALGVAGDITHIGQLIIDNNKLFFIYDKNKDGLHQNFTTDEEIQSYIIKNPEDAYAIAVKEVHPYVYILNIASTENYGKFKWKGEWANSLLMRQLEIFKPIIQKFISNIMIDD